MRATTFFSFHMSVRLRWLGNIRLSNRRRHHRNFPIVRKRWREEMEGTGYWPLTNGSSNVWRIQLLESEAHNEQRQIATNDFDSFKRLYSRHTMFWMHIAMLYKHKQPLLRITICFIDQYTWEDLLTWMEEHHINHHNYDWRRIWGDPTYSLYKLRYPSGAKFVKQWSKGLIDYGRQ